MLRISNRAAVTVQNGCNNCHTFNYAIVRAHLLYASHVGVS